MNSIAMNSKRLVPFHSLGYLNHSRLLRTTPVIDRIKDTHPVWPDAQKYYGFEYYPRPGEVDPKITPTKLFMVERRMSMNGQPYWLKDIIKQLKLDTDKVDKAIVKNVPEMNALLWKVKHLVKITPITFPYGEPKEGDKGYLNSKGQYILIKNIGGEEINDKRLTASYDFYKDPKRLDADTLKKKLRDIWLTSRK